MSIAELNAAFGGPSEGRSDDRVPPQDIPAEQSVLGGMMLSKDAIADCRRGAQAHDFYRPAHEMIFDAILDLYGRGEPADAVTVAEELTKRGDLTRIGGPAYLHQLIQSVPTAANAGYYAEIVARARGAAPAGRGRHPDRPAGLRPGRRRRRRHRQPRPRPRSTPSPRGAAARTTSCSATHRAGRWTRSRPPRVAPTA